MLTKMEKGASVTLRLKRGEQEFFSTLRINNGELIPRWAGGGERPAPGGGTKLTLLVRAYCHPATMR
jgi:hypothetical protein